MHMKRTTIALIALAASVVPVLAAGGLSGMGANLFGNYFKFGNKPNINKAMVHGITVGPMHMTLQHTRLADIRKVFGGTIQTQGSDRSLANWLCYQTAGGKNSPATDTWFISNTLGGGEFVMIVAVQVAPASGMPADCEAAPAKFSPPNMGIPGIGASLDQLKSAFGGSAGGTNITFRADEPGADALGTAYNAQYIAYVMSGGKVAAYGAGETSVPAPPKQ